MNVATLLDEIVVGLDTVSGLRVADHMPSAVSPPMAVCTVAGVAYDEAFGGSMRVTVGVLVLVSRAEDKRGQAALFAYLTPTSIKAAIEGATYTQSVAVHVAEVAAASALEVGGTSYFALEFTVECID